MRPKRLGWAWTAPLAPEALGQVGGDGGFLANAVREREGSWENGVREQASEAAWGRSRAAIPGAGGDGGLGRGEVGEDRAGQERQLREALAGLGCGDERAGGAEHLLGGERELLDRPAVEVEVAQGACGDGQGGRQHQRLGPARIVDDDEPEGRAGPGGRPAAPGRPTTRRGRPRRPPARSRRGPAASRPAPGPDRSARGGGPARPASRGRPRPGYAGRLSASARDVLRRPHDVPRRPGRLELPDLEAGVEHQHVGVGHRLHGRPQQRPLVRGRARIGRVRPHQRQRQPQPLRPDAPHPRHDPDRDRRQRLAGPPVVVAGRAPLQAWPPEPGHVDRHRPIPLVLVRPPLPVLLHVLAATRRAARRWSSRPAPAPPTPDAPPAPTTPSRSARGSPPPASPATARSPASTAGAPAPDSSRSASPPPPRTAPRSPGTLSLASSRPSVSSSLNTPTVPHGSARLLCPARLPTRSVRSYRKLEFNAFPITARDDLRSVTDAAERG